MTDKWRLFLKDGFDHRHDLSVALGEPYAAADLSGPPRPHAAPLDLMNSAAAGMNT